MVAKSKPNEIQIIRIYDAPLKAVWDAWTDPKQVSQWWGPRGFTLTHHHKELRVGGIWHYTMHGPDGTDYPNKTVYHEVEPYKRLVYDHGGYDDRPPMFRVTVTFVEIKGQTKMEMIMAMPTAEIAKETKKFIKQAGGNATWDRLAEYLEEESGHEKFFINRSFETDLNTMFEMWTNPKHFAKWLPPAGFNMQFIRADIKPGGSIFYSMSGHGMTMYGRTEYVEVTKPHRLVYKQQFCDKDENISRHPGAPTWPETMLTTVTFIQEDSGETRVTIMWEPYGKVTHEEIEAFKKERGGMTQGWTGSFDKLEELLLRNEMT